MVRTRSAKRAREEEADNVAPDVDVQSEQSIHGLVQRSILSNGLDATLSDLDKSTITKPLAQTIRMAMLHDPLIVLHAKQVDVLHREVREGLAREEELERLLDDAIDSKRTILADWNRSIAERCAAGV